MVANTINFIKLKWMIYDFESRNSFVVWEFQCLYFLWGLALLLFEGIMLLLGQTKGRARTFIKSNPMLSDFLNIFDISLINLQGRFDQFYH